MHSSSSTSQAVDQPRSTSSIDIASSFAREMSSAGLPHTEAAEPCEEPCERVNSAKSLQEDPEVHQCLVILAAIARDEETTADAPALTAESTTYQCMRVLSRISSDP